MSAQIVAASVAVPEGDSAVLRTDAGCQMGSAMMTAIMNTKTLIRRLRKERQEDEPPPVQLDFTAPAIEQLNRPRFEMPVIGRRDQFLLMVFSGALAHDLANDTTDAQAIARVAWEISEEKIPPNVHNAVKSFLNFFYSNRATPHKWMLVGCEQAIRHA
jgi:hypothetical protein